MFKKPYPFFQTTFELSQLFLAFVKCLTTNVTHNNTKANTFKTILLIRLLESKNVHVCLDCFENLNEFDYL